MGHPSLTSLALPAIVGLATGAATLAGGALALRARSAIGLMLAFSCGAVLGVALFDLLPEALALAGAGGASRVTSFAAIGFALYFVVDRFALMAAGDAGHRGYMGPGSLTIHSFTDGLGIGFAFQVSAAVAAIVALAVLAHDLCDGVNTVTLSLSGGARRRTARNWLLADAAAPLAGIGVAQLVRIPQSSLALLLALFAGFFLYIGAAELLPQTLDRRLTSIVATLAGLGMIWAVVALAGG